jgi:DNA-binding LacI/PurR family transcriptional regulator
MGRHYDERMTTGNRVTIRDVARAAGVSTTTVSDALSGRGRLPAATRRHVAAVAGRLGYRANPAARSLRAQRVGSIGLYLPAEAGNFAYYLELAAGAASAALGHGLALTLIPHSDDPSLLAAFPVDGLIAVDPVVGDPAVPAFSALGIPVVTCEQDLTPGAAHAGLVAGDYRPVMTSLLDHLAAQGVRRVALIAPGPETAWGLELRGAYQAWCSRHAEAPLLYDVPFPGSPELVRAAAVHALRTDPVPDAVVSGIDGGAIGAMLAAAEAGLRVPEDLLIASCVDSPALRTCSPAITALDLRPDEMGRRLAGLMHGLLDGTIPAGTAESVPARLVIRPSTVRSP